MSNSSKKAVTMDIVCSKCGSVGFPERIVTCAACRRISEHTYCMQNFCHDVPSIWKCEDCTAKGIELPKRRHTVLLKDAPKETPVKRICTVTRRDPKQLNGSVRQHAGTQIQRSTGRISSQMLQVSFGDKRKISGAIPTRGDLSAPTNSANFKTTAICPATPPVPLSRALKPSNAQSQEMKRATGSSLQHALPKSAGEASSRDKERNSNDYKISVKRCPIVFGNKEPLEKNVVPSSPLNDTAITKSNSATVLRCQSNIKEMNTMTAMTSEEGGCKALVKKNLVADCHKDGSPENAPSLLTKTGNTTCSDNNNFPWRPRLILDGSPAPNAYWRGDFKISDMITTTCREIRGIRAHIPRVVSHNVFETLKGLTGKNIGLKLRKRMEIWPKIFRLDPPDFDDVGLYFFPTEEQRSKETFKHLVDMVDKQGLAMQSRLDNVELLIFTFAQLPQDPHAIGITTEVCMWGVFRRIRTIKQTTADHGKHTRSSPSSRDAKGCQGQAARYSPQFRAGGMAFERTNGPVQGPDVPPGFTKTSLQNQVLGPDAPPGFLKPIYKNQTHGEKKAVASVTDSRAADVPPPSSKPIYHPNRR